MARPPRSARRRALAVLTIGATVVSGSALLAPGTSSASSHREAPYTASDGQIDNTDVYAFTSPDKANTATIIANWQPFEEPAGGPTFYPWATDAAYDVNIDNNGDAKPDIVYRWTFKDVDNRGTVDHGDKPTQGGNTGNGIGGSFLYNDGAVTSLSDPNLLFKQTYTLTEIVPGKANVTLLSNVVVVPSNIGRGSLPSYKALLNEAVTAGTFAGGLAKSYVGQSDDAFYLDLRVFDLLYGGVDLSESGSDTLSGYNVNTIALQVPKVALAGAGNVTANPVIGVWSTTSRASTRTYKANNAAPGTSVAKSTDEATGSGPLVQVSRLGNPLVNEVVVPANLKDFFNRSTPDTDAKFLGKVTNPELPYLVEAIYGIPNPNKTPMGKNRPDLVAAFLTGITGLNDEKTLNSNNPAGGPAPAEYLRLNLSTPVTASPARLGALAGDRQGFPNGRRLTDDVLDIALQAVEGILVPDQNADVKNIVSGLGDGVNANDRPFQKVFPYVSFPDSGSDPRRNRPLTFSQRFVSGGGVVTAGVSNIKPAQIGSYANLYRLINGRPVLIGTYKLNAAGTGLAGTPRFAFGSGTTQTMFFAVISSVKSSAGTNYGIPTTITVR